jgi:hypothetical protein
VSHPNITMSLTLLPRVLVDGEDAIDGALGSLLTVAMTDADYVLNLSAVPNEALAYSKPLKAIAAKPDKV